MGLALAGELEMRPLLAHCHLGLGQAYQRASDRERTRVEAGVALAEYRALDMPYWRACAEDFLADR